MNCTCNDTHDTVTATVWHRAYRTWHAHRDAGNRVRAGLWGMFADRIVRWA